MIKVYSALPETRVSAEEIFQWCGSEVAFQIEKLGIAERRILKPEESALDLAEKACLKLFANININKEDIDFLIYVTQNPEYTLPQNSSQLQDKLGLSCTLCAFDVNLGCSGYVYALNIAKAMMQTHQFKNALIVTCDCYSKIINKADRDTASIFGDAATATLLTDPSCIGNTSFGTDGSGFKDLILQNNSKLYMNGRGIFNFMMKKLEPSFIECLEKNHITHDEIDYYVLHQASAFLLNTLVTKLGLDIKKVPINIEKTANTVSSSIPLILESMQEQNLLNSKTLLLSGFGVGLSYATTILRV